jgi:hypothetical protein
MKSTAEIHRLSELTIVPTSSKIALIDRGTATGVKNVRVLPIDMPGIFGQSTPFRDLLLGDGAPGQTPPAVTASAPMLQGSSEWYAALNDARERTFPRGKPSAEKEPATPPPRRVQRGRRARRADHARRADVEDRGDERAQGRVQAAEWRQFLLAVKTASRVGTACFRVGAAKTRRGNGPCSPRRGRGDG